MVDSGNVHQLELDGIHLTLVGTAHISRSSVEEVKQIIDEQNLTRFVLNYAGPAMNL